MELATTSFRTRSRKRVSFSSRTAVPAVLARTYRLISYIDWLTPTTAARWMTASVSGRRRSRTSPSAARSAQTVRAFGFR
jgi:hypothetical protein